MATFSLIGDVELTDAAGEKLQQILIKQGIVPDCFVCPGTNIVNFCHHLAVRFGHKRYVALRKSVRNYMTSPEVLFPWRNAPKHTKKLVINGADASFLQGKRVFLVDDVVSTGTTLKMLSALMEKVGAAVVGQAAIFKQGERPVDGLIYLSTLPIFIITPQGKKELLTEER